MANDKWVTKMELMTRITEGGCKLQRDTLAARLSDYTAQNLKLFSDYIYNKPRRAILYKAEIVPDIIHFFVNKKRKQTCKRIKSESADQK